MKKVLKWIIIVVVLIILGIDFYGLWKYKLNGKQYVLETGGDDAASEEVSDSADVGDEYEELTKSSMSEGDVLFISNIEKADKTYTVKGIMYEPYEVAKDDYTSLRNGKSVEILGTTYTKSQIKNNKLYLKSKDSSAASYYVNYDVSSRKYVLEDAKTNSIVYKSKEKKVKLDVASGTTFVIDKNGKLETKKIDSVVDSHKDLTAPDGETSSINVAQIKFSQNGTCTKITEKVNK